MNGLVDWAQPGAFQPKALAATSVKEIYSIVNSIKVKTVRLETKSGRILPLTYVTKYDMT